MEEDRPEPSNRREAAKEEGRETHRVAEVSADQGSDRMATGSGKDNRHADRFASMRVGEALALRWNDILGDRIIIDERLYDGDLDDPKTLHGSREVPFDEQGIIKAALTRIWNKTKHRRRKLIFGASGPCTLALCGGAADDRKLHVTIWGIRNVPPSITVSALLRDT